MLRSLAQIISFIFHPLLITTYMLVILLIVNPFGFGVNSIGEQYSKELILRIFLSTFFIPAVAVVMLKFLGFIQSMEMKTTEERIGPYIITGIFYLWLFYNFLNNSNIPRTFTSFMLGAVIGLFIAFFINIFSKISAHAVGMGGLLGMVIITMALSNFDSFVLHSTIIGTFEFSMNALLLFTLLMAGLVGTARLLLDAHRPNDIYGGYLVGFASQFIALRFILL